MKKQQILVMHGGGSFIPTKGETMMEIIAAKEPQLDRMRRSPDWKALLQDKLGESYDILAPRMPNSDAPHYSEWKLWFEKILPLLDTECMFIGHSLGAMFFSKYFSESPRWEKVTALFLVAPPHDAIGYEWELTNVSTLTDNADHVFFYHSKDDEVVPFAEGNKFQERLPAATFRELDGRGHFIKDDFPEIIDDIKSV